MLTAPFADDWIMDLKSAKKEGGLPALDTEHANRITLLLIGALILLIFMDVQARRRYKNLQGRVDNVTAEIQSDLSAASLHKRENSAEELLKPIQKTASEIFGFEGSAPLPNPGSATGLEAEELSAAAYDLKRLSVPKTGEMKKFNFYFIRFKRARSELVRVERIYDWLEMSPMEALKTLQNGPKSGERGLLTAFDKSTNVLGLEVENGVAIVDMDEGVGKNGENLVRDRLDQIMLTLTQFPEISSVRFRINGKAVQNIGSVKIAFPGQRKVAELSL